MKPQKPWIAVLLSLVTTGLGHLYAGSPIRGFSLFLGTALYLILIRFVAFNLFILFACLILLFIYWVYVAFNAYQLSSFLATKGVPANKNWRPYLLMVMMLLFWQVSLRTETFNNIPTVAFANIPTTSCVPTLEVGDMIAYENTKDIKRYDLTLYNRDNTLYIKRTIGAPGDTIEIKGGLAYSNDRLLDHRKHTMTSALIEFADSAEINQFWYTKNGIRGIQQHGEQQMIELSKGHLAELRESEQEELKKVFGTQDFSVHRRDLYPKGTAWTIDDYGPLIVPKAGLEMKMDKQAINRYGTLILQEDPNVDLKKIDSYTFKQDYYFLLGDNRHNSWDSRFYGLVGAHEIAGKALYIWWSETNATRIGLPLNYRPIVAKNK